MLNLRKVMAVAASLGAMTLVGCLGGGGGGDDKKTDVTSGEATAAATASLANSINAAYNAINAVASDSAAVNVVVGRGMVSIPAAPKLKEQILARARAFTKSPLASRISGRVALQEGEVHSNTETEVVSADVLAQFLGTPVVDGNTLTYPLNADTLCADADDPYTTGNEETECRTFVARISIVQTVADDDTGTLAFVIDDAAPITIGYDTNAVYLEVDLAEIKAAAIAIDPDTAGDFGTAFEGALRVTLTVENATAGAESVAITVGVTTPINLAGTSSDGDYSLSIAASSDLFEISADAGAGSATVSVDVGEVHFTFPDTTDIVTTPGLLHLGGLTAALSLSNGGNILTGSNIGITSELYYDSNTSVLPAKELSMTLPAFGFVANGTTDTIEITTSAGLDFDMADDYVGTVDDGTFAFTAPMGTQIMVMEDMDGMVTYMVMDGSVTATGTGIYEDGGPINATPTSNPCYDDNVATYFPLQTVSCPAM